MTLSNDAAGACICDVNSAVAGSPDRSGATPPRTLSDYFTVNSPLSRACTLRQLRFINVRRIYERGFTRARTTRSPRGERPREVSRRADETCRMTARRLVNTICVGASRKEGEGDCTTNLLRWTTQLRRIGAFVARLTYE